MPPFWLESVPSEDGHAQEQILVKNRSSKILKRPGCRRQSCAGSMASATRRSTSSRYGGTGVSARMLKVLEVESRRLMTLVAESLPDATKQKEMLGKKTSDA
jgi:hypothetical protein